MNKLQRIVGCYSSYYNKARHRQGIGNKVPTEYNVKGKRQGGCVPEDLPAGNIVRFFFGGLLKELSKGSLISCSTGKSKWLGL